MSGTLYPRLHRGSPGAGVAPRSGYALVAGACIVNRSGALVAVHRGHLPPHLLAPADLSVMALATRRLGVALHRWAGLPVGDHGGVTAAQAAAGALICVMQSAPARARWLLATLTALAASPLTRPLPERVASWAGALAGRRGLPHA